MIKCSSWKENYVVQFRSLSLKLRIKYIFAGKKKKKKKKNSEVALQKFLNLSEKIKTELLSFTPTRNKKYLF